MAKLLRVVVDYDKCVGSRICTAVAPHMFGLTDNGQALVLEPGGDLTKSVRMAIEACPVAALIVKGADERQSEA